MIIKTTVIVAVIISLLFNGSIYFFNDSLYKIFSYKHILKITLFLSCALTFFLSLSVTHNIFDFSAFFNNYNEIYDMTLDYFDFSYDYPALKIYKILVVVTFALTLLKIKKEKLVQIFFILVLVFFNPFCCAYLNKINVVYYRAYDLIINPFTLIYVYYILLELIKNHYVKTTVTIVLSLLFINKINFKTPDYYHEDFIPKEGYNHLAKMQNVDFDAIREVKSIILDEGIENPKIISPNLLTQAFIPEGIYYYGRCYPTNARWSNSEKEIYGIFWPVLHFGDARQPENPDYDNMCEYIDDAKIDFIVQPKNVEYFDEEQNIWYSLTYVIDRCGQYAFYENDDLAVYYYTH